MPLFLVCTVMADSPLLCRPWEAAEPAPSGILDAPSASLPRRRWERGGSAAAGAGWQEAAQPCWPDRGALGCPWHRSCGDTGALQCENIESCAGFLLCNLMGESGESTPGTTLPSWEKGDDLSLPVAGCLLPREPLLHGPATGPCSSSGKRLPPAVSAAWQARSVWDEQHSRALLW